MEEIVVNIQLCEFVWGESLREGGSAGKCLFSMNTHTYRHTDFVFGPWIWAQLSDQVQQACCPLALCLWIYLVKCRNILWSHTARVLCVVSSLSHSGADRFIILHGFNHTDWMRSTCCFWPDVSSFFHRDVSCVRTKMERSKGQTTEVKSLCFTHTHTSVVCFLCMLSLIACHRQV